jgi:hypothetical protein
MLFLTSSLTTALLLLACSFATAAAPDDAVDGLHISETRGPQGVKISKPLLTGEDIEAFTPTGVPAPDAAPIAPVPRNISLHHGQPQFGVETELIFNPQGKFALLSFAKKFGNDPISIQRVDLSAGDAGKILFLSPDLAALAISPDGKRIITRSEKQMFNLTRWRIDLWAIDVSPPNPLLSFRAYDPSSNGADAVNWTSYLDATHLITCSASHTVTLWEISDSSVKEIYTLQGDNSLDPRLSPGLKYLIVGVDGNVMVCTAMTGKCAAKLTTLGDAGGMVPNLSADVKRLALTGPHRLTVCDLEKDQLLLDVGLPPEAPGVFVDWINPHLLLIDHHLVFDLDHKAMLWNYTMPKPDDVPIAHWMGERLAFFAAGNSPNSLAGGNLMLTSLVYPDSKALLADKKLPDGQFIVQPGSHVSLEVNGIDKPEDRQKIITRLTQRLTDAGLVVEDNQPIKLVAESKLVDQHQVTYQTHGLNRQTENVTIGNTVQSISFVMDGKPIWSVDSVTRGMAPMFVFRDKGQSIADAVHGVSDPKTDFFLTTGIPRTILKPTDPAGTSPFGQFGGRMRNN